MVARKYAVEYTDIAAVDVVVEFAEFGAELVAVLVVVALALDFVVVEFADQELDLSLFYYDLDSS